MSPEAQIDAVPADFNEADRRLAQARNHNGSAQVAGIDNESAYILLYSAAHKAASAVLLAAGRRVSSGERGHAVLLAETRRLLGQEHAQLMTRLDRARQQRNRVAYQTHAVSGTELESVRASAQQMIDAAQAFVDTRRP
jgi:uncharacterized protein (UPF0332 family)